MTLHRASIRPPFLPSFAPTFPPRVYLIRVKVSFTTVRRSSLDSYLHPSALGPLVELLPAPLQMHSLSHSEQLRRQQAGAVVMQGCIRNSICRPQCIPGTRECNSIEIAISRHLQAPHPPRSLSPP